MQRIERYGVIALVLLLVTIAAVSFWDDGERPTSKSGDTPSAELADLRKRNTTQAARRPGAGPSSAAAKKNAAGANGPRVQRPKRRSSVASRNTPPVQSQERPRTQAGPAQKPAFETLPANIVQGGAAPARGQAQRGKAMPQTPAESRGIEFPVLPPEEERERPLQERGIRSTPFQPAKDSRRSGTTPSVASTYKVKSGDTLSQIAQDQLGSSRRWAEIQTLNGGLDPSALRVGMTLKMPTGVAPAASSLTRVTTPESKEIPPRSTDGTYYTVRRGDVLSQIAQDHLGGASRWPEIVALNPGLNPDVLIEGRRLRLPTKGIADRAVAQADIGGSRRTDAGRATKKGKVR